MCVYLFVCVFSYNLCLSGSEIDYLIIRQCVETDFRNRFAIIYYLNLLLLRRLVNLESLYETRAGKGASEDLGPTTFPKFPSSPHLSSSHTVSAGGKRDRNCFEPNNSVFRLWCLQQSFPYNFPYLLEMIVL